MALLMAGIVEPRQWCCLRSSLVQMTADLHEAQGIEWCLSRKRRQ
jgi:hypothetical protein